MQNNKIEKGGNIPSISKNIQKIVDEKGLVVLRDKHSGKALNVSYTTDGLKFTMNKTGKYIFNPEKNYTEHFVPRNFRDPHLLKCEITWVMKAMKL